MISDRASLLLPWHRKQDALEESRLGDKQYGSSKLGIAPFYSDKAQKKTILAGELFYPDSLKEHLEDLRTWKNLVLTGVYGAEPFSAEELETWLEDCCKPLIPFIRDTRSYLMQASEDNKRILFEAQMGALRDLDFGVWPYTTSSNVLSSYAPIGAGMPGVEIDRVIGVVKSYSTCVGKGPFVCELFGEEEEKMRKACGETEKLHHRIGPIDLVATRYGAKIQAATEIALTKLDMLSSLDEIPICIRYKYKDQEFDEMPFPAILGECEPVIEKVKGWKCDIHGVRNWWDLPEEAQNYVKRIEEVTGVVIKWISVGPERHSIIRRGQT
jgi:adenylosuccinate synthase